MLPFLFNNLTYCTPFKKGAVPLCYPAIVVAQIVTWSGDGTPSRQSRGKGRYAPAA